MQYKVHFLPADVTVMCDSGKTVMDAERIAGLNFEYPCGGNGTCKKCMVNVFDGKETKTLKSCTTQIMSDITVTFISETGKHDEKVMTDSSNNDITEKEVFINSGIRTLKVRVAEAQVGDIRTDFERFCDACSKQHKINDITYNSVSALSALSEAFAKDIFDVTAVMYKNTLLDIRTDDVKPLGIAYDIGTTTIAGYLLDLENGEALSTIGALNEQVKYGGDVVSRCIFAMENTLEEIQSCVNDQISNMTLALLDEAGKDKDDIYLMSVVGNTCMHHIFAGISPISLVNVPYTPSVNGSITLNAADYITATNKNAKLLMLPVIAGFIGADTVSAILATDFADKEKTTLLLDIGTNGEMALGNKDRWVSCSTASGPAFEGAKITCGMRGAPGAIDHVWVENNTLKYSTIDNKKAVGICGSGLIDVVSVMLSEEILISSGRFNRKYDENKPFFSRITDIDGIGKAFVIASGEDTADNKPVFISQKDVREVQLAKGAIAAGIEIMAETLNVTYDDIEEVLIAGAFGNYMKPESMGAIKLMPQSLVGKIVPVGNAAGKGAKMCLISNDIFEKSDYIAKKSEFIELATHDKFQAKFIAQLDF